MTVKMSWGTLLLGAVAAFGVAYQAGGVTAGIAAALAYIAGHLLPSPIASTK